MTTLIVEDDFTARLLLQRFLSRYGECHIAVNGREGVEAFRTAAGNGAAYDLVCMDIRMPELDGQMAMREIRAFEDARNVPSGGRARIIMTTAVSDMKEVFRSFQQLCDAYLVKPIDVEKLVAHLKAFGLA